MDNEYLLMFGEVQDEKFFFFPYFYGCVTSEWAITLIFVASIVLVAFIPSVDIMTRDGKIWLSNQRLESRLIHIHLELFFLAWLECGILYIINASGAMFAMYWFIQEEE